MNAMMKNSRVYKILLNILPVISILLFASLWQLASKNGGIIPTPLDVYRRAGRLLVKPVNNISLTGHIWASMKRVLLGLLAGCVVGIPFGLLIGWNQKCCDYLKPLFELVRPIPALAWIPLMTLWFGIGETSKTALIFTGTVMPVVINTYTGVRLIPQINIDVASVFGATEFQTIKEVVIPCSLSAIMAGVKTAMGTAWIIVLAAEMISANSGLGFMIIRGSDVADLPLVIFAMIIIGVIGAVLSWILTFAERKLCPWKVEIN